MAFGHTANTSNKSPQTPFEARFFFCTTVPVILVIQKLFADRFEAHIRTKQTGFEGTRVFANNSVISTANTASFVRSTSSTTVA